MVEGFEMFSKQFLQERSKLKIICLTIILLAFIFFCLPADAWQFYNGSDTAGLIPGYVVLEPANWSRSDLMEMRSRDIVPLAWLNFSQIEDDRLVSIDIKAKDYVIEGRYLPEGKKLAVFYSQSFRELLKVRLREYLLKGFSGVVFAKVGMYTALSNSPINRSEMWRLIEDMSQEARRFNSSALILLHDATEFYDEIRQNKLISGVVEEGLYFGCQGRQVRPWNREKVLRQMQTLRSEERLILLAEDARTDERRKFVADECGRHRFDQGFVTLPLDIERKAKDGQKK
ncbi:MAG: hypothetical protein CVV42_05080 [Candidatus Riflebacteria bacterium HGW-Riflebacteria-2]|jgi:hypothetical protein|nr:MAG: hypothetical protein CVV42_05080 [Candidatus Riflebacteria bacterium HGW-Riflebacteria-2]